MKNRLFIIAFIGFVTFRANAQNNNSEKISFTRHDVITFDGASDVSVVDVDNDGYKDLIATSYNDGICWWRNDSNMNFIKNRIASTAEQPFARSIRATLHDGSILDFNNDGFVDLVSAAMNNNQVALWINDGAGNFNKTIVDSVSNGAHTVDVNDIDADGDIDILISAFGSQTSNGEFAIYYNNGGLNFLKETLHITMVSGGTFIHSGDMDGDNDQDILFTEWIYNAKSDLGWHKTVDTGFQKIIIDTVIGFHTALLRDYDKDGDLDVLAAAYNGRQFIIYTNDGAGNFVKTWETGGMGAIWLDMADFDGDGDNDLVGAAQNSGPSADLIWFMNNGSSVFTANNLVTNLNEVHCAIPADLDSDGDEDIVVAAVASDKIIWWKNNLINNLSNKENNPFSENNMTIYPNPAVSEAKISFTLKSKEKVNLTIYNLNGEIVKTIINEELLTGLHETIINTQDFCKGVYFCKLSVGKNINYKKITFIK